MYPTIQVMDLISENNWLGDFSIYRYCDLLLAEILRKIALFLRQKAITIILMYHCGMTFVVLQEDEK